MRAFTGIKDVDLIILSELDDRDLLSSCASNKYLYGICKNDYFWKNRFVRKFGEKAAKYKPEGRTWKNHYMKVIIDLQIYAKKPWDFLKHILWSPKGKEFSFYYVEGQQFPFINAPEWIMNNFYLLNLGDIYVYEAENKPNEYYSNVTPYKLFQIESLTTEPNMMINGPGYVGLEKIFKNNSM